MTLEQRVESLEKELASIKTQQKANEEFSELVRNLSGEMIKSAIRPGGVIYAAQNRTADHFIQEVNDKIVSSELFSQLS
ncbi:hypothetical protein S406_23100 [Salmonella enterica]|uniref:Uncharacterized protein n=8 Tax=Salmonella enterica TaxID=28901 RepID=A0A632EH57_SALNE|nr:hypothetical protein [Salmonella enterica]EBG5995690.1 hypothetical protein [Salmonella enterica subsp. enterica serovar Emek]EBM8221737.1 hypothetical protein [Salmonella enterica subsp. enterica serovar Muenster]ECI1495159.1 hypothetical protein [Salmonella enterica subsp. enterica serovar Derby]EDH0486318.1 hypothetical protein [Salmonella enterica subsp. enterica serovar Heidelberg]EDN5540267.1 hypothetical protein [Salmonella enterica subsp. enterica serovar Manhattan]EDR2959385.1 hyp